MDKRLIKAQQGELDAVLMYQKLAAKMKNEEDKKILLGLAADEGRHANIISEYTGDKSLKPKSLQANAVVFLYSLLGRKKAFTVISNGEYGAKNSYEPLIKEYSKIENILNDEIRHGDVMKELANK